MRLMVWDGRVWDGSDETLVDKLRAPSVAEVVVWLREQGAGEVMESTYVDGPLDQDRGWRTVWTGPPGRYLVVPLDTVPPKENPDV